MKSHVSTLLETAVCIIKDATAMCTANESAERDLVTLRSRVKHEGLSFLTITLPTFGSDFEKSLAIGYVDSKFFAGFAKNRKIPAFLRGIFSLVFDADTGRIKDDPSVSAIKGIRQVAYAFKKLKLACAPSRVHKAFTGYINDEHDLSEALDPADESYFADVCDCCWGWLSVSRIASINDLLPRHGPGSTAEGVTGNSKYSFTRWHDRLEPYFPLDSYAFANAEAMTTEGLEKLTIVLEDDEQPVKVITVPKTLKTPRIIAMEPVCMQYTQQALSQALIKVLESSRLTAGHVNFRDQQINRELAMVSSKTCRMATLDMSSASDRVPRTLALRMLDAIPDFRDAVDACRSRTAQMPSGEVIHLKKFASMGSALCFPIESMYFYTICVAALLRKRNLAVTSRNIFKVSRDVYIYGDDIIVPTDDAVTVIDHLQKYYCKVNMSKSFWTGRFRESCGMDAYDGENVRPTYLREMPPDDKRNASALISWVETSNLLYKEGYWLTSSYLVTRCEKILGKLPIVGDKCAGLGKVSFQPVCSIGKWGKQYQRPEVRTWVATPVYRTDKLEGYSALLKCLLNLECRFSNDTKVQEDHLNRTARYGAVTLKRRWVSPV